MHTPTHDEISRRAQEIWQEHGSPSGRDEEFWLEAEKQLLKRMRGKGAATAKRKSTTAPTETLPEGQSEHALAEKAASQRKAAMAPITPTKSAGQAKPAPAATGKPLWSKPHSQ
jgi:hypothetical protein